MKFLILFSAVFVAAYCQTNFNQPGCGVSQKLDNYVVGGDAAANGAHPWIVSMEYGTNGVTFSHSCGGAILNSRWILTAAHCVAGRPNTANYRIQIGAHNRGQPNSWQISRSIDKIVSHPSYSSSTYRNDVALLRLATPISDADFALAEITPVCLYCDSDKSIEGQVAVAAGWGTTFSGGSVQQILRHVKLLVTSNATCTGFYGTSYDSNTMVCLGIAGDNKDTCQGDSGGPNVVKFGGQWYNVGVTSWGRGCGDIGVYSRVNTYCSWIDQQITANP